MSDLNELRFSSKAQVVAMNARHEEVEKSEITFVRRAGQQSTGKLDLLPTLYGIAAALFEEKPLPLPRISIWEENMCGWAVVPHGIERLQNNDLTCKGNLKRERAKTLDFRTAWMAAFHVRRDKAALSSGCKAHPAIRSRWKQSEQSWR